MPSITIVQSATPIVLAQSGAAVSHTGDTSETVLATIPVAANAMGANGLIVVRAKMVKTGTAGTIFPRMYLGLSGAGLGGTVVFAPAAAAPDTTIGMDLLPSVANAGATNSQIGTVVSSTTLGVSSNGMSTAAVDTTKACEIVISGQLGSALDTITLAFYQVLLYPYA